jgi:hypothetical protein
VDSFSPYSCRPVSPNVVHAGVAELRHGARAALALSMEVPPPERRLWRVTHAFSLTWVLLAVELKHSATRRRYLRSMLPISVLTLALAAFAVSSPWTRGMFRGEDKSEAHPKRGVHVNIGPSKRMFKSGIDIQITPSAPEPPKPAPPPPVAEKTAPVGAGEIKDEADKDDDDKDDDDKDDDDKDDDDKDDAVPQLAKGATVDVEDEVPTEQEHWSWPSLSALYAALVLIERTLLALTRDYQHMLSRGLCVAAGAVPEDPEVRPRLRVSWKWIRKKIGRKIRGALILGSIAPLAGVAGALPLVGRVASALVAGGWGFYWLAVFALAACDIAWGNGLPDEDPVFVRVGLAWGTVPVVGWIPRIYAKIWRRFTRGVRPACASAERAPYEALGLGLSRLISGLPVINGFLRPVVPVASQLALRPRLPSSVSPGPSQAS